MGLQPTSQFEPCGVGLIGMSTLGMSHSIPQCQEVARARAHLAGQVLRGDRVRGGAAWPCPPVARASAWRHPSAGAASTTLGCALRLPGFCMNAPARQAALRIPRHAHCAACRLRTCMAFRARPNEFQAPLVFSHAAGFGQARRPMPQRSGGSCAVPGHLSPPHSGVAWSPLVRHVASRVREFMFIIYARASCHREHQVGDHLRSGSREWGARGWCATHSSEVRAPPPDDCRRQEPRRYAHGLSKL